MKLLFIHPVFPSQFQYFGSLLSYIDGWEVRSIAHNPPIGLANIREYCCPDLEFSSLAYDEYNHPANSIRRGIIIKKFCEKLKANGYTPDIVIAHPRWGHSIYIKDVWPSSKLALYLEYYFKGLFLNDIALGKTISYRDIHDEAYKNVTIDLSLTSMDVALSPTNFQKSTFPAQFQKKISVIHDGINTKFFRPSPDAFLEIGGSILTKKNKVLTFVSRSLEPIRGFPSFMRCLPEILEFDSEIIVLIVGTFDACYGNEPEKGGTWRDSLSCELKEKIDPDRIFFLGNISRETTLKVLQISKVHVHLSLPFTLSWSILEAMSVGCSIVSSMGNPVQEVIEDGVDGLLVNIDDLDELSRGVIDLFTDSHKRDKLGANARKKIVNNYDAESICFPRQLSWLEALA